MIERYEYLEELKKWKDKDLIKVITGIRRCGKSTLFELYIDHLKKCGIKDDHIISINLEFPEYDFKDYKDKNIDSIVLGCTHYPFIKKEILEEMPGVSLIDGSVGVAKEVKRQLEEHGLLNDERNRTITIYNSLTNKEEVSSN